MIVVVVLGCLLLVVLVVLHIIGVWFWLRLCLGYCRLFYVCLLEMFFCLLFLVLVVRLCVAFLWCLRHCGVAYFIWCFLYG